MTREDINKGRIPHISRSQPLDWDEEAKTTVANLIDEIATSTVEIAANTGNTQDPRPLIEDQTDITLRHQNDIEDFSTNQLLNIQHEIAYKHPDIDLEPAHENMPDILILKAAQDALGVQNKIAADHPGVDSVPVAENKPDTLIKKAATEALAEFCKRQAMHEFRRRQFQTDLLDEPLESRIYW